MTHPTFTSPLKILLLALFLSAIIAGPTRAATGDAIVPGVIRTDATFEHLGAYWPVSGDNNHNSAMTLEFRKLGDPAWRPGAPAVRAYPELIVDGSPLNLNYWAASALFLQSGQSYELRLTLTDPEGGGVTRTVTAATRSPLVEDPGGRQLYVIPGSGGGTGSQANPFHGLQAAANAAIPGDVFHVAAGVYAPFQLLASGTPGHPIVFRGPDAGSAVIDGAGTDRGVVTLGESNQTLAFVILEGFTIQNGAWGIDAQNTQNILIDRNTLMHVHNGILNRRDNNWELNQTITNNVILGLNVWPDGSNIPEEEGIDLRGTGNVAAYNRVEHFSDCISMYPTTGPSYGNDVFGNEVSYCVDDGIEIDYNRANVRAYRNRVMNSRMGVSVQPIQGGPAYIFRNEFFNLQSDPIKMHNDTTGFWVAHNTSAMVGNGQSDGGSQWRYAVYRNNLILGTCYAFEFTTLPDVGFRDFDYDAWGTTRACTSPSDPFFKWNTVRYSRLVNLQAAGVEVHGVEASFGNLVNALLPAAYTNPVVPGTRDLRLQPAAPEINAGASLPNLNDPFVSDGQPDMGAFEAGQPLPVYGPQPSLPDLSLSAKLVSRNSAAPGEALTYTILLRNRGSLATGIHLTDDLPAQVNIQGSPTATSGSVANVGGHVTWSGDITSAIPVTITIQVTLGAGVTSPQPVTNTAVIDDGLGLGGTFQRQATFIANGVLLYLPYIGK